MCKNISIDFKNVYNNDTYCNEVLYGLYKFTMIDYKNVDFMSYLMIMCMQAGQCNKK